jgi:CBS domain-containing protein
MGNGTIERADELMLEHRIGCLVVVDSEGQYEGLISERLFFPDATGVPFMRGTTLELFGEWFGRVTGLEKVILQSRKRLVRDVKRRDAPTASVDTTTTYLSQMMITEKINHVAVLDSGWPVGVVSRHDLLKVFTVEQN